MSAILHRVLDQPLPIVAQATGVWITDNQGKRYLDALAGGVAVSCLGYGNDRVTRAVCEQMQQAAYFHTSFFSSEAAEQLASALIQHAPAGLSRVCYSSGGSEAVETSLKLARQYWVEKKQPQRRHIISRRQSYHGGTLGTLAVGGNQARRETYSPLLFDAHFIAPCYSYRLAEPGESEADYGLRAANELECKILELGAENVAAFICEPVVGATLGCVPAAPGYLKRIRQICDQYGVLLIFDEVMCGAGRTGFYYACEADQTSPDLLALAKGLGGGFQPIGATLVGQKIVDALRGGSGSLKHGFTYMGHNVACAAALEVHRIIYEDRLLEAVTVRGQQLHHALTTALADHPHVGDIRGRGLFIGIELVTDRPGKTPFSPALKLHALLRQVALDNGLLLYPNGGTVDGVQGDHVLLAPAYTVTAEEIDEIVRRFVLSLNQTIKSLNR